MAMDAANKTGVGFMDAFHALRTIGLTEAAVRGIVRQIFQRVGAACEVASHSVMAAASNDEVEKCRTILKGLVKDGDHIVLGINGGNDRPSSAVTRPGGRRSTS